MTECLKSRRNAFDRNAEFEVFVDKAIEKLTSTEYFSLQPSFWGIPSYLEQKSAIALSTILSFWTYASNISLFDKPCKKENKD